MLFLSTRWKALREWCAQALCHTAVCWSDVGELRSPVLTRG